MRLTTFFLLLTLLISCTNQNIEHIHVGFIGPQTVRATNLGIAPGKAMELAIKQYNNSRNEDEPEIILHLGDDQWDESRSVPLYNKLRTNYDVDAIFISN
ncbi:hypothetical protein, partial [Lishizhenia sp.]|uniref:hypothetical protein n=1 Tax=Lishizhenia sp. TaxID=2497594 RepID=UPI00299E8219